MTPVEPIGPVEVRPKPVEPTAPVQRSRRPSERDPERDARERERRGLRDDKHSDDGHVDVLA